jgi:murein DD-endopeptidase MepM/ murein hydrolase activator NlpD
VTWRSSPVLALGLLACLLAATPPVEARPGKAERVAMSRPRKAKPERAAREERQEARRDRDGKSERDGKRTRGGSAAARARAERLGLGTLRAAGRLLAGKPEESWVRAAGGGNSLPGTLRFPVAKGWFVRGFGSGEGGYHQAMDIGGEVGWNVRAAAPGLVAYSDDGVDGYGNLVLIVHPGGWVTSYAHNQKNSVVAGQKVSQGDVIAELGSTGRSKGPHVHFELLHDGENCDPAPLLRPFVRHKNGKSVHVSRAVWKQARKRPRAVACHPRKHHPAYEHDSHDGDSALTSTAP